MKKNDIVVAAYYFPDYHPDPRNDRWHGKNWTEWELLKEARPRYQGHRQPIIPAWGYFDESDPAWAAREVDLAADHRINSFIYDWYWYEDGPYLQDALEKGFLRAPNNSRMSFALMWANHDLNNMFPARATNRQEILASGKISAEAFERMTDYIIEKYMACPNYLRINGAPFFSIYEMATFIAGVGGIKEAGKVLDSFRNKARSAGFPGLHLNICNLYGYTVLPGEVRMEKPGETARELGFSSMNTYAWVHHYNPDSGDYPRASYQAAAEANYTAWDHYRRTLEIPYYPSVSMGWDSSPRTVQSSPYEKRGYPWTGVIEGNTPEAFAGALGKARDFVLLSDPDERLVMINAWNEWTEGSYLLPDTVYGNRYLESILNVFGRE